MLLTGGREVIGCLRDIKPTPIHVPHVGICRLYRNQGTVKARLEGWGESLRLCLGKTGELWHGSQGSTSKALMVVSGSWAEVRLAFKVVAGHGCSRGLTASARLLSCEGIV